MRWHCCQEHRPRMSHQRTGGEGINPSITGVRLAPYHSKWIFFMHVFVCLQFEAHPVRAMLHDGSPFFVFADVRDAVCIEPGKNMAACLDDHEREFFTVSSVQGSKREVALNMFGLS